MEEIVLYEYVGRISKVLDQPCEGLKTLGLLRVMRAFPHIFKTLFTTTTNISSSDVLECLEIPRNLSSDDTITISCLRQFICEATEEGT